MEDEKKSVEEMQAEQTALLESKEDEVRASIIEELGLDEVDDADKIEKLVNKQLDSNKNLATAIGQKIKHRTRADELEKENKELKGKKSPVGDEDVDKKVEEGVRKQLEQRDFEELDLPDDLKKEVKRVAEISGVSIKAALKDPYIAAKIDSHEKAVKAEEAAVSRKNKGGSSSQFDPNNPPVLDINDPDSVKSYDGWFKEAEKRGL